MIVLFVVKNNPRIHGGLNSEKKVRCEAKKKKEILSSFRSQSKLRR